MLTKFIKDKMAVATCYEYLFHKCN